MLHVLLVATLLWQDPAAAAKPPVPATFAQLLEQHFAAWDKDGDGTLSAVEIDGLCVDATLTGEPAAAAAALKRIVRSGKYAVPELTRANLTQPPKGKPATPDTKATKDTKDTKPPEAAKGPEPDPAAAQDRRDSGETPATTLKAPNFQASHSSALRKIATTNRVLFGDDTPDLDRCRQGPLGNCYFVAAVGAFVHRDSAAVKQLVQEREGGGYEVRFADGKSIAVTPLTDAEVALSGTTGDEGLWLPVLEKALGSLRREANPERYTMATATDAIAKGGSSAAIIRMLTGHQTARITLKKRSRGTVKDADGKSVPKPPAAAGPVDTLAAKVRSDVGEALKQRRLVTCSTGTEPQPPGISGKHAYAVLAFDAAKDELTLWNPHGNTFRPKGEPGRSAGYPTKAGVFCLPVRDFVQVFGSVSMETDQPLPEPKVEPKEAPAKPG
ncbi:MAG: hypothetical protein K8J09_19165 [Planctomycetes bacterium]|nr:hypothetical protein [Planctomycetota bacterium]